MQPERLPPQEERVGFTYKIDIISLPDYELSQSFRRSVLLRHASRRRPDVRLSWARQDFRHLRWQSRTAPAFDGCWRLARNHLRVPRRPWVVDPARGLRCLRRNGRGVFHGARATGFDSLREQGRARRRVLLCFLLHLSTRCRHLEHRWNYLPRKSSQRDCDGLALAE